MQLYTACYFHPVGLLPPAPCLLPPPPCPHSVSCPGSARKLGCGGQTETARTILVKKKLIVKEDIRLLMRKYHKISTNKSPNIFECQRIEQTNIRIYTNAQDLTGQITEYIWMPKIWPKECPHIFWWGKVHKYEYVWYMQAIYWNIDPYLNRPNQTQIGHTLSKLVKSGQRMVKWYVKWVHRNILIYLDAQELNKQISEFIQMLNNWSKKGPNIYGPRKSHKYE